MKLFRLRFIVLGLLQCVFHVWCRTCGTSFTSPADSAHLSQVVVEGRVAKVWDPLPSGRYNVTINIRKVRKGDDMLINGKRTKLLTIGEFAEQEDKQNCVTTITKSKQKWYFFLKSATNSQVPSDFLKLTAFPVKVSKKTGRDIRKIVCRRCAKKPVLKKIRAKDVREGRRIKLGCRVVKARPPPKFRWEKDGVEISSSKRIKIKSNRRGSRLTIRKALKSDGGEYRCIATNVVGTAEQIATFKVKPRPNKNGSKRPGKKVTTTPRPPRYISCLPEDKDYCLNGGKCRLIVDLNNAKSCVCLESYIGKRCQYFSGPIQKKIVPAGTRKLERDRTLAIIGIVIGILVFICICIASYFLAKRRRDRFLKRREKRRLEKSMSLGNSTNTFPFPKPPFSLENSVNHQGFAKNFHRQNTVNTDTQTDDINFSQPNSNPKVNLYLNPIENQPLRSSIAGSTGGQRNSRSRLSGVSIGGDGPPSLPHSPDTSYSPLLKQSDQGKEKGRKKSGTSEDLPSRRRSRGSASGSDPRRRGEVPRITISDSDSGGEDIPDESVKLRISESTSPRSARRNKQRASVEHSPRPRSQGQSSRSDSERSPRHYSQTLTSESPSTSADELRAHFPKCNGQNSPRKCSDSISWNERGSPEHPLREDVNTIEDPRYKKKDRYYKFPKGFHYNGDSPSYNAVHDDEPSIPI